MPSPGLAGCRRPELKALVTMHAEPAEEGADAALTEDEVCGAFGSIGTAGGLAGGSYVDKGRAAAACCALICLLQPFLLRACTAHLILSLFFLPTIRLM